MCQLAYASNLTKLNLKQKNKLFQVIQKAMTKSNRSGYGLASKTVDGQIEISRTLDVETFCHVPNKNTPPFCKSSIIGHVDLSKASEVLFHARTSTNSVSLENTHPFVIGETTLVHNGVLQYSGERYFKKTDNDTEDLTYYFNRYGLDKLEDNFTGYAAFLAFKNDLTYVVKDSTAYLHYGYSQSLDCHFFATTKETLNLIKKTLKINMTIFEVLNNQEIILKDNKIITSKSWSGLQYSSYAASKSHLSLGRDLKPSLFDEEKYYYDSMLDSVESGEAEMTFNGEKITYQDYLSLDSDFRAMVQFHSKTS